MLFSEKNLPLRQKFFFQFEFEVSSFDKLLDITFVINGKKIVFHPEDYLIKGSSINRSFGIKQHFSYYFNVPCTCL